MQALVEAANQLRREGVTEEQARTQLLKDVALHHVEGTQTGVQEAIQEAYRTDAPAPKLLLPSWQAVRASDPPKAAPVLIDGMLRLGHVGLLVAKAKSSKSWAAVSLCVCVAAGINWLGFAVAQGRCLYIDPEVDHRSLDRRFAKVAKAFYVDPAIIDASVTRWSLRGVSKPNGEAPSIHDVVHDLRELRDSGRIKPGDFSLVVVDSASCLLDGDENASRDVRKFTNALLEVAEITQASVLGIHHEGKAQSGDVQAASRGRGSSVWTDAPDLLLSLVEVLPSDPEEASKLPDGCRAFRLEVPAIREFGPVEPVNLLWQYPRFHLDVDAVTADWKPQSAARTGGKSSGGSRQAKSEAKAAQCVAAVLARMLNDGVNELSVSEAVEACGDAGITVSGTTLKGYADASGFLYTVKVSPRRCMIAAKKPLHLIE